MVLSGARELVWVSNLLLAEIVLWILNYALDLAQLPRLLQWKINQNGVSTE